MIDTSKVTGYEPGAEHDHDEYHSSLEVDDTSGWKVFIVPGLLILFLIAALALFLTSTGDNGPDPRVAARLQQKQQADAARQTQVDARQQAAQQAAWDQQQGAGAAPATGNAAGR